MKIISRKEAQANGDKLFYTGKLCKHGHDSVRYTKSGKCKTCNAMYQKLAYDKDPSRFIEQKRAFVSRHHARVCEQRRDRYRENIESERAKKKAYYEANIEKERARAEKYRSENRELCVSRTREWRDRDREHVRELGRIRHQANKHKRNLVSKEWRAKNPINVFIRNSLARMLTNWQGKRKDAEKELGYTYEELKQHLESQFKEGMSWDNRSEWHIDHIKPVSVFINEGVTDPSVVNAMSNLQPLWAKENQIKGCKY